MNSAARFSVTTDANSVEACFDVAVIGMGPTGMTLAAKLARLGRKVIIVEKHPSLYGDPRAGGIDHEIVRVLHSIDAAAPTMDIAVPVTSYAWRNKQGELLIDFISPGETVSGYEAAYMQFQPVLENALVNRIKPDPNVLFLQGWELVEFDQNVDNVEFVLRGAPTLADGAGAVRKFRADYLVGADGANSFVRKTLGINCIDLGFNETRLDVDVKIKRPLQLETPMGQICDPARPKVILPLGKHHHRWEWAVHKDERPEYMLDRNTAWTLLAEDGIGPDDVEIIRQILYTFTALMATRWREGRVLLAGDAAHTQPPFMGQGMCSGVRDSVNLAWKLDMMLDGRGGDALLDSYQAERYAHTRDWTVISILTGQVSCESDPIKAEKRDALFRSGFVPPMPEKPYLKAGVIDTEGTEARGLVGRLVLNARVEAKGRVDLFDHTFYDHSWMVLTYGAAAVLDDDARRVLDRLGARLVSIGEGDLDANDIEGRYRAFFAENGIEALIMRPDFYAFGGSRMADLSELVLRLDVRLRSPAPPEEEVVEIVVNAAEAWA